MSARDVTRPDVSLAISTLLTDASLAPSALVLEGEAGIGKTTSLLAGVEEARGHGFRILSTRPAASESVMAYMALADLLGSVAPSAWADLPEPQRRAVDRIMLRTNDEGDDDAVTDQRAVAAGFASVIDRLARQGPVLLAIDDLQWLDSSSVHVLGFLARRLSGPVGLLGAVRTTSDDAPAASWIQLPRPDELHRITLRPLPVGALHAIVSQRLGRSYPRPTMLRVHETSGGNPLYAIELARWIDDGQGGREVLPQSLTELVSRRIDGFDEGTETALFASSCLAAPTVDLVARAIGTDARRLVEMLEPAEREGIIGLDGHGVRFAHPILAKGVYQRASPTRRRSMHRRLAELIDEPESQARHLALAATSGDASTLHALDAAADIARRRGAPEAAAELLTLALSLGGDTPERRIQLAGLHFNAGDNERARTLLEETIAAMSPGGIRANAWYLLAMVRMFDDSFTEAAALLERGLGEVGQDLALRAQTLVTLSFARFNAGMLPAAIDNVEEAVEYAERLGLPGLLGQALSMRAMLIFLRGDGFDATGLRRALEIEDREAPVPSAFRPSVQHALLLACTGQLERAHDEMAAMRRRYVERGDESEMVFIDFHTVFLEIWRGDFKEANRVCEDLTERAQQLGGDLPRCVSLTARGAVAAYAGRVDQARTDAGEALAAGRRSNSQRLAEWPVTILGFLEVSLGHYDAAFATLQSEVSRLDAAPDGTEIITASFVPDAVEAMIALGRLDDAEPLIDRFERNGRRLDRPWMLALGARCRGMSLAARGDVDGAIAATQDAITQHDRLPMPFERARTQLLLGQLQRRSRHKRLAALTLGEALGTFVELGTPLWAARARSELERTDAVPRGTAGLTPSEQRVAELAASGMTNRDMAAALFISPKTVEANLSRIYRKLGIRSRAELGALMRRDG